TFSQHFGLRRVRRGCRFSGILKGVGEQNSLQKAKHTWLEIAAVFIAVLAFLAAAWQGFISNDTERRQLRAYVGVDQAGLMGLEDSGPIRVGFYFTNHGQTPASKFRLIG